MTLPGLISNIWLMCKMVKESLKADDDVLSTRTVQHMSTEGLPFICLGLLTDIQAIRLSLQPLPTRAAEDNRPKEIRYKVVCIYDLLFYIYFSAFERLMYDTTNVYSINAIIKCSLSYFYQSLKKLDASIQPQQIQYKYYVFTHTRANHKCQLRYLKKDTVKLTHFILNSILIYTSCLVIIVI